MQLAAPEVVDFSKEPKHVQDLYGIGEKETDDFGRQLLLARRLAEKGVRFIQICHAGGGNGGWDAHGDIKTHAPLCRATDKPIAGLIRDLKQRGMLDSTLVVWTSEFGRSPWSQNTTGRDHNPRGYTAWLAGGGVKGGIVHGATDDVGYKAVEQPRTITATCTPRSCISSASTTRRWSTISSAGPCAWWKKALARSKRSCHE